MAKMLGEEEEKGKGGEGETREEADLVDSNRGSVQHPWRFAWDQGDLSLR